MILIGQYDSPFVRRVGIALKLYGIPFEHRPWSTFGDRQKVQEFNPLMRVPTLVLDNGDALVEANLIIDYIDSLVAPTERLYPQAQPARYRAQQVAALAGGFSDKAIALFYEKVLHKEVSETWVERCLSQIVATLAVLEADRAGRQTAYWFGATIGHADIAVAASLRHAIDVHAGLIPMERFPALKDHSAKLEALPVFKEISQPFIAPA